MGEPFRPVAPVDPTNLRPMLFLEAAREIMLDGDWPPPRHRRLHQPEGRGHTPALLVEKFCRALARRGLA
jgi:hypothetical protein